MRLTKQGVRNLDAIGPKPKRGHVGRSHKQEVQQCRHAWRWYDRGCECESWIVGERCICPRERCDLCGQTRR